MRPAAVKHDRKVTALRPRHTADTRPATVFILNGAPQTLVGSEEMTPWALEALRIALASWRDN